MPTWGPMNPMLLAHHSNAEYAPRNCHNDHQKVSIFGLSVNCLPVENCIEPLVCRLTRKLSTVYHHIIFQRFSISFLDSTDCTSSSSSSSSSTPSVRNMIKYHFFRCSDSDSEQFFGEFHSANKLSASCTSYNGP